MKEDISKYLIKRTECPLCLSSDLGEGLPGHKGLQFPLLPVCVDTPIEEDNFVDFTICICNNCGLIMMKNIVDPEILYKIFHSDGIGPTWDAHYSNFADLIKKHMPSGKVMEIGAGQGKLIKKLLERYDEGIEVMDPQYEGPKEGVIVHNTLLDKNTSVEFEQKFDAVISSHTLEHFTEFKDYFTSTHKALKEDGMLFTSIPNQEFNFARGYGNQLNPEHPSICTNTHWMALHYQNGFQIEEIYYFGGHSIMFAARKSKTPIKYEINVKELSKKIMEQYETSIQKRIEKIKNNLSKEKENWIFGASNLSQPLFMYGLDENVFSGVLDNSPLKHGKRLYGTSLICRKPEELIAEKNSLGKEIKVFLNLDHYNEEVKKQLLEIDPNIEYELL